MWSELGCQYLDTGVGPKLIKVLGYVIHSIKIGTSVIQQQSEKIETPKGNGIRNKATQTENCPKTRLSLRQFAMEPKVMALRKKLETQILRGVQKRFMAIKNVNRRRTGPFNLPTAEKG